jgi:hypothetical protein
MKALLWILDPALTGGIEILLCAAGRVVVLEQASVRAGLLRRFMIVQPLGIAEKSVRKNCYRGPSIGQTWGRMLKNGFLRAHSAKERATHRHKPYGQFQSFSPDDLDYRPFKHISVDWITGL